MTPGTAKWPKPKNEDEFEDMVLDALRLRWRDPNATRNGRRGQGQDGVDIFGTAWHRNGAPVGAQCKNTESPTLKQVIDDVEKAMTYEPPLSEYLFVIAADRDARLQKAVRAHFETNPAPFPVMVLFWQDVLQDMAGDSALFRKHWPAFGHWASPVGGTLVGRQLTPEEQAGKAEVQWALIRPDISGTHHRPHEIFVSDRFTVHNVEENDYAHGVQRTLRGISTWFKVDSWDLYERGVAVLLGSTRGEIRPNGEWDVLHGKFASAGKHDFLRVGLIPYRVIDRVSTECVNGDAPHIYCHFAFGGTPYEGFEYYQSFEPGSRLDPALRRRLFPEAQRAP